MRKEDRNLVLTTNGETVVQAVRTQVDQDLDLGKLRANLSLELSML